MFEAITTVVHVLACLFLIVIVLLQTGKGAEMGAVFGGSSSTVFGSSGAGNFLTRLTTGVAVLFMCTSLGLTYFSARHGTATIFDDAPGVSAPAAVDEPVAPAEAPVPDGPVAPAADPEPPLPEN
jgi:preprotein translocase subunit SecG